MKKNTLSVAIVVATLISALASFYTIHRAIKISESSTWLVPMAWVSLFVVLICIASIFLRSKMETEIVIALSLLFSVIFSFTLIHLAIVIACIFVMLEALRVIRSDLDLNVKISLWKSLSTGKFKMILALSLIISSQYYFTISSMSGVIKTPRIDFSSISEKLVGPLLGVINPNLKAANDENLTVDQFIIQSQKQNATADGDFFERDLDQKIIEENIPQNLTPMQREALIQAASKNMTGARQKLLQDNQQLVLLEGRRQLSEIAGKKLDGSEKISVVFSGMINDKINSYFDPNIRGDQRSALFSLVLTLVLFLTIWPLGSLLCLVWFGIVILTFKLFVRMGLIEIRKVTVEREMIV